jgi:PAS domain S-box-containing protein
LFEPGRYLALRNLLLAGGQIVNERLELTLVGGESFPVELSLTRLGEAGDTCHVVALLRPLADQERRDRQLRHTIEYLGAILDAAPEAVLAVDRNGFVTYANPAIEGLLGHAPEDTVDKPVSAYVRSTAELDRVAAILRTGGEAFTQDIDFRRKDEAIVRVSVSASGLRLPDGTHAGAVLVLHDVTERRRFEAELSRKNSELEHYVHTVSHDLRSPLVSLLGFSRLLRQDYSDRLDDQARHFLDRIEQAGRTMETLTNDLLELSRIGDRSEHKALVDPLRVLSIVQAELKPRLEERGVTLVMPENPPLVLCDRTRLYQVFANLVGNALDHMGSVAEPRIAVQVEEQADGHMITVADNGCGIDPVHHERIFEIFQSLGPRNDGRRGTGVGLAIVRKIAETHGGRVWVESGPGRGSVFRLLLPRS